MKKIIIIICGLTFAGMMVSGQEKTINPQIDSANKIVCGLKSVWFKKGYAQIEMAAGEKIKLSTFSLFNFGDTWINSCFFINKKKTVNNNGISWKSDIIAVRDKKEIIGQYTVSLVLQKDNLIKVSWKYKLKSGIKVKGGSLYLDSKGKDKDKLSGYYNVKDRKVEFELKKFDKFIADSGVIFTFFPDNPEIKFRIIPQIYSSVIIKGTSGRLVFLPDKKGCIEFLLDITTQKQANSKETK